MSRAAFVCFLLLLSVSAVLLSFNACGGGPHTTDSVLPPPPIGLIQHVVIIFQENRTPDNLFQDPVLINRGAEIRTSGVDSSGNSMVLNPTALATIYDLDHSHNAFVSMYDSGKMDGANNIVIDCFNRPNCPPPNPGFYYVQTSDVGPYFQMAEQYTFGDHMFQTNQGPSFPAHQFILAGTSAPSANSNLFAAENPTNLEAGCAAPSTARVALIDPSGSESSHPPIYPCFEHPTLTDELNTAGISWRYYTPAAGSIWTAPNAIQHMCGPNANPPNATACVGSDWLNKVVIYSTQNPAPILTDISNKQLATVSWVIPADQNSDHAGNPTGDGGPSWVAAVVNAIGSSSYWANTAIIVTWDDWGGWYDHVPPPHIVTSGWGSGYVYGFRVPLIVISPYAKAAYISKVNHDFGSILNFVEENFRLPSLGYADADTADALLDCFDFTQTPLTFRTISAKYDAAHFLHDKTPPEGPDDE